jgi:phage-related protein
MQDERRPRKVPVVFYRTAAGSEVVRGWLRRLKPEDRGAIGMDLMRLQFRWPVGMPLCRSLDKRLWELRSDLKGNRIARVIFAFVQDRLVVLNAFIKKSRKTPSAEIEKARKRLREFEEEGQ